MEQNNDVKSSKSMITMDSTHWWELVGLVGIMASLRLQSYSINGFDLNTLLVGKFKSKRAN